MIRLFIPFALDPKVKEGLNRIIKELKPLSRSIKWVNPANMHLTAQFLGDTDPKLVPAITNLLNEIAPRFAPVSTVVDHLGGFPNLKRPLVIWAGMENSSKQLIPIADEIRIGLTGIGIKRDDKPFKPHLTLGRVRQADNLEQLLERVTTISFPPMLVKFDRLELIHSTLTPKGPIYKSLASVRLGPRFE